MPPDTLTHLLTTVHLTHATFACGAPDGHYATWDTARVTCPGCIPGRTAEAPQRAKLPHRPALPEKEFQAQVIDLLKAGHWTYYHTHNARHSPAGFPDIVAVRGGRLVVAELKTALGRVSDAQKHWLQAFRQFTPDVYVWRPEDWPTIEEVLR